MRSVVFVLPVILSLYYVLKGRQDLAFLNVYLPCLILIPDYYLFRIPHLPPESAASWALLPLAVSLFFYPTPKLELRRMDLWLVLYVFGFAASELLKEANPKDGFVLFGATTTSTFLSYIVGRRLIEPRLRILTIRRIVLLFLCLAPFILYEYVKRNPFFMMASHFHLEIPASVSMRQGHPRIQASFVHAILAGIMFFVAFLLNSVLSGVYRTDRSRLGPITQWMVRFHVPTLFLLACLWFTRSRGPMISAGVGFAVLQIPKFRHRKVAAGVIFFALAAGAIAMYIYMDSYTSAVDNGTMSEEQTSAIYRRELLKNYEPIAEQGGWLGWGALSVPEQGGQVSIDNTYLIVKLTQGKFGYCLFLLMIAESLGTCAYSAFSYHSPEARRMAFTLLACLIGLFLCLTAVYLGPAAGPMCFLLLGWSQSIRDDVRPEPKFHFKRVFA